MPWSTVDEYNPATPLPQARPDPFTVPAGYQGPMTPEVLAQAQQQYAQIMAQNQAGRDALNPMNQIASGTIQVSPEVAFRYLTQALHEGNTQLAQQIQQRYGITQDQLNADAAANPGGKRYNFGDALGAQARSVGPWIGLGIAGGGLAAAGAGGAAGPTTGYTGNATVSGANAAAGSVAPSAASYAPQFSAANLGATGASWGAPAAATGAAGGAAGVPWASGFGSAGAAAGGNWLDRYLPYINQGAQTLIGAYGANQAADAESDALQGAIDEQRRQYDQNRQDLMPWMQAGQGALGNLQNPQASFAASPGYEWARNEGQRDIGNSFAARGGAASGNALKALTDYNTGLAQQDYGNWWNQQSNLAGLGQTATTNVGQFGQNAAGNIGNAMAGQGLSRSSGIANRYGAIGQGLNDSLSWLYRRRQGG